MRINSVFPKFSHTIGLLVLAASTWAQSSPFELGNGNQSATYDESMAFYHELDDRQDNVAVLRYKKTDSGHPLHLVVIGEGAMPADNRDARWAYVADMRDKKKAIVMIMNGIHPGEPDGIDASMMWARDLATKHRELLRDVVVCIIPVYNIGGALNRGCCSRVNQLGPEEYGFRGNAQYLDLNRDFVKGDAKNTWAFWEMYQEWRPDIFVDNHTTNGADYQYTMTLLTSTPDKLDPGTRRYLRTMLPLLEQDMKAKGQEMCPYVNIHGGAVGQRMDGFYDSPRYSSGYAALFGAVAFVAETHMLKPFADRVWAAYHFMESVVKVAAATRGDLLRRGYFTEKSNYNRKYWPIDWKLDTTRYVELDFNGYAHEMRSSVIPGMQRLYYDRTRPMTWKIKYFNRYLVVDSVDKPFAYVVPQAWEQVVERLEANGGWLRQSEKDTTLMVEIYTIESIRYGRLPYEGHFLHSKVHTSVKQLEMTVRKGDWFVILPNRFAMETLEPRAPDAFLAWNFFDPVLQQKEWFSAYVFEETAAEMVRAQPNLLHELEAAIKANPKLANDYYGQLYWLYKRSPHMETGFRQYPVFRIPEVIALPIK